jgi:RHS repeat-associated protein
VRVTNSYDAQGRVFEQRDGLNKLTTFDYSTPGQTVITDPRAHATTFTFDSRARVLTQTDVVGANTYVISYTYDPTTGVRLSVTDRNAKTTDFTYDERGNVETKTEPQVDPLIPRYVTQYDYDTKNNLTVVTDPRGFTSTNSYHATTNVLLSVTAVIDGSTSAVTKYEYTDATNPGMPTKIIAPRGNLTGTPDYAYATTLTYDTKGNVVTRIDPDGAKTTFVYDLVGRMTSFVDPDGYVVGAAAADHTWTIGYDENDQDKSRTDPLGKSLLYGYDGAGNRTSTTDRNGNVTTYTYDANARLAAVLQKPDPIGNPTLVYTTIVGRDDNGNLTRTTQANGVITDYGFDALDRMTSMTTHPAVGTDLVTSYVLDGNGNVQTKMTADGTVVTNTYDALNRLKSVAATGLATITYDYDPSSNRVQMTDGTGTTIYQYDGLGRLTQNAQPNGTLGYVYDRDGNRTTLTYPGATGSVTYFYTPGGRLDHLTDWASRTSSYTYTAAGLVSTLQYPNGMKAVYTYDRAQRLTAVVDAVGSSTLNREVYTLDGEGNRVVNDEYVQGISTAPSTTWAASVQVNSNTGTSAQDHPEVAIAPDGSTYLVWDDLRDGNANIYLDRRDPATGNWSATDVKVNSDTGTRVQLNPAIAVDSASSGYIVWQDERNGAGKPDIFYRKRTATGTWVASDVKISNESGGGGGSIQRNPRIAGKADGDMTALWVDFRSSQKNIWASTLTNGTGSWAANTRVTPDNGTSDKDLPDVAVGADGTSYAVWQDNRNGNFDIYFASLPAGGAAWSSTGQKVSDDPGTAAQRLPRVGVDAEGNVTVVWLDERVTPHTIRMSRRLAGTSTWTASVVATDAAARPVSVALAVRADGTAQLAFGDTRGTSADIYRSEYDPWLRAWSTTSTLASDDPGAAAQQAPSIAYGARELIGAWRDDRAGNADVRARRATLAGGVDHFAYTYDGLNRLTEATGPVAESFVLDSASNISSRTGPSATYAHDTSNRVTSDGAQTFTWSNADRLTARGSDTFTPDPLGRLTASVTGGTSRSFAYSGDGLLQSATQGATTTYLWDTGVAPAALLRAGSDNIVQGLGPLYAVRGDGTTYSFAHDGLGSVRGEVDAAGLMTKSFRYRVYGALASSAGGNPTLYGYAGELRDSNGLIFLRARWYDPTASIFVTRDSYLGTALQPISLNGYCYAARRPTVSTDPFGLDPSSGQQARVQGDVGQCLVTVLGSMLLIEASTVVTLTGLALLTGGAVAIPLSGGMTIPLSGPAIAGGLMLEGVALTGYATAWYMMRHAVEGPCRP